MATGTVDFFNDTGGYGFIETEDADEALFSHRESLGGPDPQQGQEAAFEIESAGHRPLAQNRTRL